MQDLTPSRRPLQLGAGVLLVAAVAAAAIALNLLLLGSFSTSDEPVGRLSPRVGGAPAPSWTVRPVTGEVEDEGADD
jgi:hypothetical protein